MGLTAAQRRTLSRKAADNSLEVEHLVKTEAARDWLRLKVIDLGEGIPRENLDRVLTPYFTTKNRGDEGRGFGLGLAISRKIVALHGGLMDTVTIDEVNKWAAKVLVASNCRSAAVVPKAFVGMFEAGK